MKKKYLFIGIGIILLILVILMSSLQKKGYSGEELLLSRTLLDYPPECKIKSLQKITEGTFPKWSKTKNLIAFNKVVYNKFGLDGKFEIFTMRPDATELKCLTCNKQTLPNGHKGEPYWHPNGEYIVFSAENTNYKRLHLGLAESPDIGRNHDVWMMKSDGSQFWKITNYEENWGVIRPSFSHDGTKLYWNEEFSMEKYPGVGCSWKYPGVNAPQLRESPKGEEWGLWRIKVADISFENETPKISNVRSLVHPGLMLLEGFGFSPDDKEFIFTSANTSETEGSAYWGGDIYTSDINGGSLERLTNTPYQHDENAEYSPDGKKIIWSQAKAEPGKKVDLYLMDVDGGHKVRLTYFSEPGYPEYLPSAVGGVGEIDWSPEGTKIVFGFGTGKQLRYPFSQTSLYLLTFEGACGKL